MLYGGDGSWLQVVPPRPGCRRREIRIDVASLRRAKERLLIGEFPPLLPSELRRRDASATEVEVRP